MTQLQIKKITFLGLFASLAIILGYIEMLLPLSAGIPGVKIGITNLVIVFVLYAYSWKEALGVSMARILVIGFLFGNLYSILFSMAGALLSLGAMSLMKKLNFHCVTVSISGGVAHNIGQIVVATFVVQVYELLYYLPVLLIAGTIAGVVIGIVGSILIGRLMPHFKMIKGEK